MTQDSANLDRFVDVLSPFRSVGAGYEDAERRAVPPGAEVGVSEEDVERAGQIAELISAPHPVVAAPAANPFDVEEFWRAVAHALNRPFRIVLVEADRPYYLLSKADPENGRSTEGKLTYCARRGYVIVLHGETTAQEKHERKIPEGIRWLAEATDGFTAFPARWVMGEGTEAVAAPEADGPAFPVDPSTIIVPTWMI